MNRRLLVFTFMTLLALGLAAALTFAQDDLAQQLKEVESLCNARRWTQAEVALRGVLDGLEKEAGAGHPSRGMYQHHLGQVLARQGRYAEALEELRSAVMILEQTLPAENPVVLEVRHAAALVARQGGQPGEAADLAAPLLDTMRDFVASGRAGAAGWDQMPSFGLLFLDGPPRYDEARVAEITALLGLSLADAGRAEEADPVLREASKLLGRVYRAGHPELVRVSEALEEMALARGDEVGRRYVGEMGHTRHITFTGNQSFPEEILRKALTKNMTFVLASHPAEPFHALLEVIPDRLRAGYLHAGFPEAKVQATYAPAAEGPRITVNIDEGPSFRRGGIRVEGLEDELAQALVAAMQQGQDDHIDPTLVGRIRTAMDQYEKNLPPSPQEAIAEAVVDNLNQQIPSVQVGDTKELSSVLQSGGKADPDWVPGQPARFRDGVTSPMLHRVRYHLAEMGWPLAKVDTRHDRKDDGTADLIVRVNDKGPAAVVGKVAVIGNDINTADAIREASGLMSGKPVKPGTLDEATLSLWYSGRFFPFRIEVARRGPDRKEVDFTIRVNELNGFPSLSEPAPLGFDAVMRFVRRLDAHILDPDVLDGDLVVDWIHPDGSEQGHVLFGWSGQSGMYLEAEGTRQALDLPPFPGTNDLVHLALGVTSTGLLYRVTENVVLDLGFGWGGVQLRPFVHVIPNPTWESGKGRAHFYLGTGIESAARNAGEFIVQQVFHPGIVWAQFSDVREQGDALVLTSPEGLEIWLDPRTGHPINHPDSMIRIQRDFVRTASEKARTEVAALESGRLVTNWSGVFTEAMHLVRETKPVDWTAEKQARAVAFMDVLAEVVARPEVFGPVRDYFLARRDQPTEDKPSFWIPADASQAAGGSGLWPILVGVGYLSIAETLLPPDTWVSDLARELLFVMSGRTQHTAESLDRMLKNPSIGPYGCVFSAQLLGKLNAPAARRFLERSLDQATAEGFRQDWQLLIDSSFWLSDTVLEFLEALAALDPAEVDKLVTSLGEEAAAPLQTFLEHVRKRPANQPMGDWVAPALDRYWNEHLGATFRARVEQTLHPPVDAEEWAVTVNGVPLARWFVRAQNAHPAPQARLIFPDAGDEAWHARPGLARAVRLELVRQGLANRGMKIEPSVVEQQLPKLLPSLQGATDERWREVTGMSREHYVTWVVYHELLSGAIRAFETEVGQPTFDETRLWYETHGADWGDTQSLVSVYAVPATPLSPTDVARCERLTSAVARWLAEEPVLELLQAVRRVAREATCEIKAQGKKQMSDCHPDLRDALHRIEPGEITAPLMLGQAVATLYWQDRLPGPKPDFETVYMTAAASHKSELMRTEFREWLRSMETQADVRIIEPPGSLAPEEEPERAFTELLDRHPQSLLAKIGKAWETGDLAIDMGTEAVNLVIEEDILDAADLALLSSGLVEGSDVPAARRCLDRALELDRTAALDTIKREIRRHAGHSRCTVDKKLTVLQDSILEGSKKGSQG